MEPEEDFLILGHKSIIPDRILENVSSSIFDNISYSMIYKISPSGLVKTIKMEDMKL